MSNKDFSKYIDSSAPIGIPIRTHKTCPLCGHRNTRTQGFVVIPDRKGYLLFCHYCGKKKWIPRSGFSPSAVRTLLKTPKRKVYENISLPSDMSYDIPAVGKVWLYEYGLTESLIRELGFGYSEKYNRLIMPVYNSDGELIHWQGRYLKDFIKDKTPKYITRTKSGNYFWAYNPSNSTRAILVEDMLSAIKVGLAGYAGICLFGSYLKDETINSIADLYEQLTVWLDPDKRKAATKYTKRFSSFGYNFNVVLTATKDPKEYSATEIKQFLK
jgi:hypothetical protein